jgi:hypothetical protein
VIATTGEAQTVVRISTGTFLEAISSHPDIREHAKQILLTGATTAAADHNAFVNEFGQNALLTYQKCWMLEQQLNENQEYRKDLLSIRTISTGLAGKQRQMVRESDREGRDLQAKLADAVNALNELTRHAFGEQRVLPKNCVRCFEMDEQAQNYSPQDDKSESIGDIEERIAAQEKLAADRSPKDEAIKLMEEFYQLHIYKTKRWQTRESIAVQKAAVLAQQGSDKTSGGQ